MEVNLTKATLAEVRNEYMRRKGGPNKKSFISLFDLAVEMGWKSDEFKLALIQDEQSSTHVSKSTRRNRRREKRQVMMREKFLNI